MLAVPLLLLVVMPVAGFFDDELSQEVVDLVRRMDAEGIEQEGNAYFALVGLTAPSGTDIMQAGRRIHEEDLRQIEMARKGLDYNGIRQPDRSNLLKFKGESSSICSVSNDYLYEEGVCKSQSETDRMLSDNRELLARYYRLLEYKTLVEPPLAQLWVANDVISLQRLAQADIEKRYQKGEISKATELLVQDLAFWQGLQRGKYHLLSGVVLQVGYSLRITAVSELLLRWPNLLRNAELKAVIAEPFHRESSILQAQMDLEFMKLYFVRNGSEAILDQWTDRDKKSSLKWFADRLYRRNATLNSFHGCLREFYTARASKIEEQESAVGSFSDRRVGIAGLLTNLTGEMTLYSWCPKRLWLENLDHSRSEARRNLVMLQIMLLERKIPEAAIPAFLENADPSLRDPKTGKAAMWNPQRRVAYFSRSDRPQVTGLWVRLDTKGGFKDHYPDPPEPHCGN